MNYPYRRGLGTSLLAWALHTTGGVFVAFAGLLLLAAVTR